MKEMCSRVTWMLVTPAMALVGLTGCSGGTSTTANPAPSTAVSVAAADTSEQAVKRSQTDYLVEAGKVGAAYDTFYNLYDSGSTDLPALQKAAATVADVLGGFGKFVRDYDWPSGVPSDLPSAIHDSYTTGEGGMHTWVRVASADSLAETTERLKATDTPEATSDVDTDALRKAIGLPPSYKSSD